MKPSFSPLRYPGGKTRLYPLVSSILRINGLRKNHYVEPYAGGCGLALSLLFHGDVSEIHINNIDVPIWAFWHSILENTEAFIAKIREMPVTIEQWHLQREIHKQGNKNDILELGFSTFFLNRTNRSGIIKRAGPIGGRLQKGNYKLDCRYNVDNLIDRITNICAFKNRIHLYNNDALNFIRSSKTQLPSNSFYCIDPPYFNKGAELYISYYMLKDHVNLSREISIINLHMDCDL